MSAKDSEDMKDTNARLDIVIKLLAAMYARELKNNDAIIKLDYMQLSREAIAEAVGVTTHNVAQVLYANKKADERSKNREAVAEAPAVPLGDSEVQQ